MSLAPNTMPSSTFKLIGTIEAQTIDGASAGTDATAWVDAGLYTHLAAVANAGAVGAGASVAVSFDQATSNAGAGSKALTDGRFAAQTISSANGTAYLEGRPSQLDTANNFRWVRTKVLGAVGNVAIAVALFGVPKYETGTSPAP